MGDATLAFSSNIRRTSPTARQSYQPWRVQDREVRRCRHRTTPSQSTTMSTNARTGSPCADRRVRFTPWQSSHTFSGCTGTTWPLRRRVVASTHSFPSSAVSIATSAGRECPALLIFVCAPLAGLPALAVVKTAAAAAFPREHVPKPQRAMLWYHLVLLTHETVHSSLNFPATGLC